MKTPRCIVIAGPNGAGKTTFAREFLPKDAGVIHFVNADLIAAGLSPLRPELAPHRNGFSAIAHPATGLAPHCRSCETRRANVPRADVLRRFVRGWQNFQTAYKPLAAACAVYDNSGDKPQLLETKT